MFTLYYHCNDCGYATLAAEGEPEDCKHCLELLMVQTGQLQRSSSRSRSPGDIRNGIELVEYVQPLSSWRCNCLFCKQLFMLKAKQFGVQLSCGCLRQSTLKNPEFLTLIDEGKTMHLAECECKVCGLRARYNLAGDVPIICKAGCVK